MQTWSKLEAMLNFQQCAAVNVTVDWAESINQESSSGIHRGELHSLLGTTEDVLTCWSWFLNSISIFLQLIVNKYLTSTHVALADPSNGERCQVSSLRVQLSKLFPCDLPKWCYTMRTTTTTTGMMTTELLMVWFWGSWSHSGGGKTWENVVQERRYKEAFHCQAMLASHGKELLLQHPSSSHVPSQTRQPGCLRTWYVRI